jgi:hypothetical protein
VEDQALERCDLQGFATSGSQERVRRGIDPIERTHSAKPSCRIHFTDAQCVHGLTHGSTTVTAAATSSKQSSHALGTAFAKDAAVE